MTVETLSTHQQVPKHVPGSCPVPRRKCVEPCNPERTRNLAISLASFDNLVSADFCVRYHHECFAQITRKGILRRWRESSGEMRSLGVLMTSWT